MYIQFIADITEGVPYIEAIPTFWVSTFAAEYRVPEYSSIDSFLDLHALRLFSFPSCDTTKVSLVPNLKEEKL